MGSLVDFLALSGPSRNLPDRSNSGRYQCLVFFLTETSPPPASSGDRRVPLKQGRYRTESRLFSVQNPSPFRASRAKGAGRAADHRINHSEAPIRSRPRGPWRGPGVSTCRCSALRNTPYADTSRIAGELASDRSTLSGLLSRRVRPREKKKKKKPVGELESLGFWRGKSSTSMAMIGPQCPDKNPAGFFRWLELSRGPRVPMAPERSKKAVACNHFQRPSPQPVLHCTKLLVSKRCH